MRDKILSFKKKAHLFELLKWICIVVPFVVLVIIKRKEWITSTDEAISLSLGCVLSLVLVILIATKKAGFLKGMGTYIVVALLSYFLKSALDDLTLTALVGLGGYIVSIVFDKLAQSNYKKYDQYKQAAIVGEVMNSGEKVELDKNGNIK